MNMYPIQEGATEPGNWASTPRWLAHTTTRTTVCPPDGVLSSDSYFFNPNIGSTIEYLQMQLLR